MVELLGVAPDIPEVQYREVDGASVPFVEYGQEHTEKSVVALVHGLNGCPDQWGQFPQELSKLGHHVIAVGIPDGLEHPEIPRFHNFVPYIRGAVEDIAQNHKNKKKRILGLSWGGLAVQQWALDDPDVEDMVVVASIPATFAPLLDFPSFAAINVINATTRKAGHAAKAYGGDYANGAILPKELLALADREIDEDRHGRQVEAVKNIGPLIARSMYERGLWWNGPRALFMYGGGDRIIPGRTALNAAWMLHMERYVEEDGGHLFMLTRPQKSAKVVDNFFHRKPLIETHPSDANRPALPEAA
jgi:pimeloyl-ACP methyl ester carboxylesterase